MSSPSCGGSTEREGLQLITDLAAERQTLAEQLAEIAEPAPVELDPEDGYAGFSAERNTDSVNLDAARAEYVNVG